MLVQNTSVCIRMLISKWDVLCTDGWQSKLRTYRSYGQGSVPRCPDKRGPSVQVHIWLQAPYSILIQQAVPCYASMAHNMASPQQWFSSSPVLLCQPSRLHVRVAVTAYLTSWLMTCNVGVKRRGMFTEQQLCVETWGNMVKPSLFSWPSKSWIKHSHRTPRRGKERDYTAAEHTLL